MAKRINLQGIISKEIEKGNKYIMENGNFVSEDNLKSGMMDEFKRLLSKGEIDMTVSFVDFQKSQLAGMRNAEDLLTHINNFFADEQVGDAEGNDATC